MSHGPVSSVGISLSMFKSVDIRDTSISTGADHDRIVRLHLVGEPHSDYIQLYSPDEGVINARLVKWLNWLSFLTVVSVLLKIYLLTLCVLLRSRKIAQIDNPGCRFRRSDAAVSVGI